VIVDANVLIYATQEEVPFHQTAKTWLEDALNGPARVGRGEPGRRGPQLTPGSGQRTG
jgi:predicted nucleic acid-binding protein